MTDTSRRHRLPAWATNGFRWSGALCATVLVLASGAAWAAAKPAQGPSEVVFVCEVVALLIAGRLMGELMVRLGQPAVMGQLIAGIMLGPSVLGAIWPTGQQLLFPAAPEQKAMIDAMGQFGILLLLLLTGMETDLSVVRRSRQAAFSISICGIAIPFVCGVALGELMPADMLSDPGRRLITALFLGVALAISSVKIVAMVVREVGFLRRTIGQVIVAAAIIDDTIGWIIMSVVLGLAAHGAIDLWSLARSLVGVAVFLAISFTIGRHVVFRLIRWTNDRFVSELPVITTILAITGIMALITDAIGVHTVLGAFIAGILVGQSPILTRHIDEQLRGFIVALFMPIFFGLAGLSTNLAVLARPSLALLTIGLIAIASIGKFGGAFLGGRLGGMSGRESIALGCGMNARGSTEVIIASIGLSMGVLRGDLFTAIVAMAVVTTMSMPPMLRWSLARLPMGRDEAERLEREELEATGFVSRVERMLVAIDASPSGQFASGLAGLLAGARRMATTVLYFDYEGAKPRRERARQARRARAVIEEQAEASDEAAGEAATGTPEILTRVEQPNEGGIAAEAAKGYGLLLIGREPASEGDAFHPQIAQSAADFGGPYAIAIARGIDRTDTVGPRLNILAPVTGTAFSRHGAEFAVALAQASRGSVTALHFATDRAVRRSWPRKFGAAIAPLSSAEAIIREIVRLGDPYGVDVKGLIRRRGSAEEAILRQAKTGNHNLLVLGVSLRPGQQLSFGHTAAVVLAEAECSLLFVVGEQPTPMPEENEAPARPKRRRRKCSPKAVK